MNVPTLSKYEAQIYAVLRIVAGFLFLWHGSQKLLHFPPSEHEMPLYIVAIAGPIEFLGGILIMIGFLTRWAAFIACGEMAFAYWSAHGLHAVLPIVNHGELAVLYCFLFLFFAARGSGIFSIDHYIATRDKNP
ncbi:MAG: LuxR family transcriptional regulator [Bacteroidetes bacterium]|nr:LuxR family transcriptional regulator [Bacteroidota bacterium]